VFYRTDNCNDNFIYTSLVLKFRLILSIDIEVETHMFGASYERTYIERGSRKLLNLNQRLCYSRASVTILLRNIVNVQPL
jgi:hypothetical protein